MNIKTIDRDLYIIQIMKKGSDYEYMQCIDNLEEKNNQYDVLKVMNYSLIYKIMPLLNEQLRNKKFTDFVDCFSQDNIFYAVFKHTENKMLSEYLEKSEHNTLERLEILKNLIEKIVMSDIPVPVQTDILFSEGITVSESLCIDFKYDLSHISDYSQFDFKSLQKALKEIIRKILKKELDNKVSEKLTQYYMKLSKGLYNEHIELYSEYIAVYDEIKNNLDNEAAGKKNKWLKIWEKIKIFLRFIKPFAVCLLIVAAFIYLLYTLFGYGKEDTSQYTTYKSIGTLVIKEYQSDDVQKGK